jgi:hypothetical protein
MPKLERCSCAATRSRRPDATTGSSSVERLASRLASRCNGASPGRISRHSQLRPPVSPVSMSNSGNSPARTSEDFPLPELPTTVTKRDRSISR